MIHTVRRAFIALPLGLLLGGCSGGERTEFRSAPTTAMPARTSGSGAGHDTIGRASPRGNARTAPRSDALLGYVAPSDPRYAITLEEIRELVQNQSAVIIDARGSRDFALGHIRGAFNMPAGQAAAYMLQLSLVAMPNQLIIIYCNGPHCDSGDMVYEYLAPQGFTNMRVFKPGWEELASASDLR